MTIRGTAFRVKQSTRITQDFGKWVVRVRRSWLDARLASKAGKSALARSGQGR
jgi:hypothetical protein